MTPNSQLQEILRQTEGDDLPLLCPKETLQALVRECLAAREMFSILNIQKEEHWSKNYAREYLKEFCE